MCSATVPLLHSWAAPSRKSFSSNSGYHHCVSSKPVNSSAYITGTCQLIILHYRYTISHTQLIAAHLYRIRRQFLLSNRHPHQSIETRTADAHTLFSLKGMYINPHTPPQVAQAKPRTEIRHFQISSNLSQARSGTKTSTATTPHHKTIYPLPVAPEHTLK